MEEPITLDDAEKESLDSMKKQVEKFLKDPKTVSDLNEIVKDFYENKVPDDLFYKFKDFQ